MQIRIEGLLPTCACFSFGLLFIGIFALALTTTQLASDSPKSFPAVNAKLYQPVVLVTLGWNALYFCFLQGQAAAAFWVHKMRREGAKKDDDPQRSPSSSRHGSGYSIPFAQVKYGREFSNSGMVFMMDRTVGNMLEQSAPFLVSVCECTKCPNHQHVHKGASHRAHSMADAS